MVAATTETVRAEGETFGTVLPCPSQRQPKRSKVGMALIRTNTTIVAAEEA